MKRGRISNYTPKRTPSRRAKLRAGLYGIAPLDPSKHRVGVRRAVEDAAQAFEKGNCRVGLKKLGVAEFHARNFTDGDRLLAPAERLSRMLCRVQSNVLKPLSARKTFRHD